MNALLASIVVMCGHGQCDEPCPTPVWPVIVQQRVIVCHPTPVRNVVRGVVRGTATVVKGAAIGVRNTVVGVHCARCRVQQRILYPQCYGCCPQCYKQQYCPRCHY